MHRILYLVPDFDIPSWGVGLLYHHVRLLNDGGFQASVLHGSEPFRLSWLDVDVPVEYLDDTALDLEISDIVVVPEVLAHSQAVRRLACRRVVFVQNGFVIFAGSDEATTYQEMGFERALVTMPHLAEVVGTHCGMTPTVVPPFVAPYFFVDESELHEPRRRELLIFKKLQYGESGRPDYDIVTKLLRRHFRQLAASGEDDAWQLVELTGRTHIETARAMRRAAFLLNVNTHEGFNVSVAEAMAAGCIPICYEAVGGQDYLRAADNAYVFPNNGVYDLVELTMRLTAEFDSRFAELSAVRTRAFATACRYQERDTAAVLLGFFRNLL